jgi:uncharacterized protein YigE (DUF2233 family)
MNIFARAGGPTLLTALFFAASPIAPAAAACRDFAEAGASYAICEFDARKSDVRLFLSDSKGAVFGSFAALESALKARGEDLIFATNAGMYDENRQPVGLYIENGKMLHAANTRSGFGNFHMKPNGVFWIDGGKAGVTETGRFLASRRHPAYATQSGPLLVSGGRINPHIHDSGNSEKIRNGVCVTEGQFIRFVISNQAVTFHAFAHLFRERLRCADALFLDGTISSFYAPQLERHDRFRPLGPMIGVVGKKGQ